MQDNKQDKMIQQDVERILDILHQIPQEEIPAHLDARLQEAIKEEGRKITASKGIVPSKKNKNWYLRATVSVAACFIVGFVSLSMYNDGIGLFSQDSPAEESMLSMADESSNVKNSPEIQDPSPLKTAVNEEKQNKAEDTGDAVNNEYGDIPSSGYTEEPSDRSIGGANPFGSVEPVTISIAADPAPASVADEPVGILSTDDSMNEEEYSQSMRESLCESDNTNNPSRNGSMYNTLIEEFIFYIHLVNQYLGDLDYELISYTRDITTGNHLFNILILADEEGNAVNTPIILVGAEGEIYEQQQEEEQSVSGD